MNKRAVLIFCLLLFFAGTQVVYWFKLGYNIIFLREGLYLATSCFAAIAGLLAVRRFGFSSSRSMTLLLLTAGVGYWFFGELLFNYFQYILAIYPFPSVADFFYILAYPCLVLGLINELKISAVNWRSLDKLTVILFLLVALLFGSIISYFGIYLVYDQSQSLFFNAISLGYGVGDLLLILAASALLILIWEFRGSKFSAVWLILFISFVLMLLADILFALYNQEYNAQQWLAKSTLDSLWMASYLLFGYAFCEFNFSLQETYKKVVEQVPADISAKLISKKTETP